MGTIILICLGILVFCVIAKLMLSDVEKQRKAETAEYNRLKDDYEQKLSEYRESMRKQAEEKYRKMGFGDILHRMVMEGPDDNGDFIVKFVGISSEVEERLLKAIHEDERCELVDVVHDKSESSEVNNFNTYNIENSEIKLENDVNVYGSLTDFHDNTINIDKEHDGQSEQ